MPKFTDDTGTRQLGEKEVEAIREILPHFEGISKREEVDHQEIFFTIDTGEGGCEIIFKIFPNGEIEVTKSL